MADTINNLQGTQDLLPDKIAKWQYVEKTAIEVSKLFGFFEIRTPNIEYTELFVRSVGDTTDVVQKEMYTFNDRGGRSISLRPEVTACVVRAAIQNNLFSSSLPQKLCYISRCYRAERPQRGRYREFNQFGVELLGTTSPTADAEVISLVDIFLKQLGLKDYYLNINSIGCPSCRPTYQQKLLEYFNLHKETLCTTCLERLERNPLRIIDCKNPNCHNIAKDAPRMIDQLCNNCETHFSGVKARLLAVGIDFKIDPNIVRGLDYYTKTVFEFITENKDGMLTICGGGRYDGLVEMLGGGSAPGIGFGLGLERLIMTMEETGCPFPQDEPATIYIAAMGETAAIKAVQLTTSLRRIGISCDHDTIGRTLKAQMRYANKIGAVYTMVLGDDELVNNIGKLKRMSDGHTCEISLGDSFIDDFSIISITDFLNLSDTIL